MAAHLMTPHGGTLVDLFAAPDRAAEIAATSRDWPSHNLPPRQLCDRELLLDGGFSTLTGFMTSRDHTSVCVDIRLGDGTLWPIPITLDVGEALADRLSAGDSLALRDLEGVMLAVLHVEELWRCDREAEAEAVFGTGNREHLGVAQLLKRTAPVYVGGRDGGRAAGSEISKNGGIAVCAPIVPYDEVRKQVRAMIEPLSAIWKS